MAPDGLIASSPGFKVNEQNNAMAAWQNTIVPPDPKINFDSVKEVKTEPSRAKAFKKTHKIFGDSVIYSPGGYKVKGLVGLY